jgi:psp operon transcriptional activator
MLSNKNVLLGESPLILDVLDQISRVAPLNKPVLILGERGTGKELVAERLHYLSKRWDQSFVKVNCASMNDNLLESELFGHEAGAFTGASKRHLGRFERADGGSLFLDELATSSASVQEKLLRVVEYGEFERVGGHQTVQCDVRLVAATHADVKKMSDEGRFRADLLDRLAFDVIHLPPLRLRRDDILLLAEHFARRMCLDLGWDYFPGFSKRAVGQMLDHEWPGNVRELKNVVERSVYRMDEPDELLGDMLIDPFLPPWQATSEHASSEQEELSGKERAQLGEVEVGNRQASLPDKGLEAQVSALEQQAILEALEHSAFNQKVAAQKLNLTYHQLRGQMRKHNMIPLKSFLESHNRV